MKSEPALHGLLLTWRPAYPQKSPGKAQNGDVPGAT